MNWAVIDWLPGAEVPWVLWLWISGGFFVAGAFGFLAGALIFKGSSKRRLKKRLAAPGNVMPIVREQLEAAQQAAKALKERNLLILSEEETRELSERRDYLLALLNDVIQLQQELGQSVAAKPRLGKTKSLPFQMTWLTEAVDEPTKLITAEAIGGNLKAMLDMTTENGRASGFLFIKLDGFDRLESRYGAEGRDSLFKKFTNVIVRAVRDVDLVCRYEPDTLAVLFPSLEEKEGPLLAHSIRKSLLNYQFRLSESGPTVILNAHFGYTDCLPHENEDLILNRAGNALATSQSRGKNQMHAHDGELMRELRRSHFVS